MKEKFNKSKFTNMVILTGVLFLKTFSNTSPAYSAPLRIGTVNFPISQEVLIGSAEELGPEYKNQILTTTHIFHPSLLLQMLNNGAYLTSDPIVCRESVEVKAGIYETRLKLEAQIAIPNRKVIDATQVFNPFPSSMDLPTPVSPNKEYSSLPSAFHYDIPLEKVTFTGSRSTEKKIASSNSNAKTSGTRTGHFIPFMDHGDSGVTLNIELENGTREMLGTIIRLSDSPMVKYAWLNYPTGLSRLGKVTVDRQNYRLYLQPTEKLPPGCFSGPSTLGFLTGNRKPIPVSNKQKLNFTTIREILETAYDGNHIKPLEKLDN